MLGKGFSRPRLHLCYQHGRLSAEAQGAAKGADDMVGACGQNCFASREATAILSRRVPVVGLA